MNATERHAELVEHGWTTRVDGRLIPPPSWPDTRPHSLAAAWEAHRAHELAHVADQMEQTIDWTDDGGAA